MAINDSNKKRPFWQRAFSANPGAELEKTAPKEQALPEETRIKPEPAVSPVQEEPPQNEPAPLSASHKEDEDIEDRALRLAGEEQKKREWAAAAMEEVNRAEAARQKADKEAALKLARARAFALQQQSTAAQEAASAALQDLSRAEQAYSEALRVAEEKRAEEKALRQKGDGEIALLTAENDSRLSAAHDKLASLAAAIKTRRSAAESAAAAGRQAELDLEEAEAELRRLNNDVQEAQARNHKKIEEIGRAHV